MDESIIDNTYTENSALGRAYLHGENSSSGVKMQEVEDSMKFLTRVDLDLAASSEKLVNLQVLLMHLLAWDNDLKDTETSFEKALVFDLLSGILDSEVREVENFMDNIQAEIADAHDKVFFCKHLAEVFTILEEKLHDSEESLNKSQEQILELKMQSAKLQRAFSAFKLVSWKEEKLSGDGQLFKINAKSKRQTAEQLRQILRMLEKSLARELDLEKKLSELKQNEEQLQLKLHYTEQVSFRMEEAAEVVWGRFLEAENAAEVLMGISKEMVGRLQIVQFNLNGSLQREAQLNSKLQDCIQQLDAKDATSKKLENSIAEHMTRSSEVPTLMEKVKSLEEQLEKYEFRLKNANVLYEESQGQLSEMENIIESLKETAYEAESRAETAETKLSQLTDSNVELTEENNFLKGSTDDNAKTVSILEKQLRELEIQLQHAKASSEASQEQQNMLYSAIWDMETLIDDLKSKVSKAENKTESAEEQCMILSEANMELNKELSFLKSSVKMLETSLDQANNSKAASAKEINQRTGIIMDMVVQLARERERIQNQLFSSTKENKILLGKLKKEKGDEFVVSCNNVNGDDIKLPASENDPSSETCGKASEAAVSLAKSPQVDKSTEDALLNENEDGTETVSKLETVRKDQAQQLHRISIAKATFVVLIALLVVFLLHKKPILFHKFL